MRGKMVFQGFWCAWCRNRVIGYSLVWGLSCNQRYRAPATREISQENVAESPREDPSTSRRCAIRIWGTVRLSKLSREAPLWYSLNDPHDHTYQNSAGGSALSLAWPFVCEFDFAKRGQLFSLRFAGSADVRSKGATTAELPGVRRRLRMAHIPTPR
jgi:hypothetical protein